MAGPTFSGNLQQTTNYRVVLPFYIYASISFLIGCVLLLLNTELIQLHYFSPHTLAITHVMALGWGTMMILGASHQLLPVLVEGKLDSDLFGYITFVCTAIGIPILAVGFYIFHTGWMLQSGAILINTGIAFYVINVFRSSFKSSTRSVHAWYMVTASLWLFSTTFLGLFLVFNFTNDILTQNSVFYLTIHAHMGIIGWFLLLIFGVGSRLIPMFLISKYVNDKVLWIIYFLINLSLVSFIIIKLIGIDPVFYFIPLILTLLGVLLFARHCLLARKVRIRRKVDEQMNTSLLSIFQMLLPIVALLVSLIFLPLERYSNIALIYGFCIFFGWITAIILGMTFKTLPFIVWNIVYHKRAQGGKTPAPKELFSEKAYNIMLVLYITGFVLFIIGLGLKNILISQIGASSLVIAAGLYVYNIGLTILHKAK